MDLPNSSYVLGSVLGTDKSSEPNRQQSLPSRVETHKDVFFFLVKRPGLQTPSTVPAMHKYLLWLLIILTA